LIYPPRVATIRAMTDGEIRARRIRRAELELLVDPSVLPPGEALELIGGELVSAERQSPGHYAAIRKTARALVAAFGPGWDVRQEGPLALDDESEPEPDVAVVPGEPEDYALDHPSRAVLAVEVAESSLRVDRLHKGSLYARAGLADYWVLNLVARVLEVYREPIADPASPFGWRYARREALDVTAQVTPLAAPGSSISVSRLFPRLGA
jgi:Uma2 family endonuclease